MLTNSGESVLNYFTKTQVLNNISTLKSSDLFCNEMGEEPDS